MSLVRTANEDDDNQSLPSLTNSDDEMNESSYHNHRTCSRYGSCNGTKHDYSSIDSNPSKPTKGDIRSIDNESCHRQKFDGNKWRRICCISDCTIYLNGGIFYENWLCRKHYLLAMATDKSSESDTSTTEIIKKRKKKQKKVQKPSTRKYNHTETDPHTRGDIRVNPDGTRDKYDGRTWRSTCKYENCISFLVRHGYCHRHDMEMRKKPIEILPKPTKIPPAKSPITQSKTSVNKRPRKGDIQFVRQKWNGTKWYSLCQYYTRDCTRRARGYKCAYLCDIHYREYKEKQNDQILLSPKVKRKKTNLINDDHEQNTTIFNQSESIPAVQIEHNEQCIQTDVTYPLDSIDLRQGCILIEDDDNNDQYESASPQLLVYIKKEEEDYILNKQKIGIDVNSVPMNCKLELTKLEM